MKKDKRQSITDISSVLFSVIGNKTLSLTSRQLWILNYIYQNKERWISPTEIGEEYGKWLHHGEEFVPVSYHSAAASPSCKVLTEKGLINRNKRGHYQYNG